MLERLVFADEVPTWRTLERELRAVGETRWRLKEGRQTSAVVEKRLIDEDRPHWPKALLAFHAHAIEVSATWPVLDQVLPAFAALGARRVTPPELAREQRGRIDYFTRYDDGSGGLLFRAHEDNVDAFLLWNGFASGVGERLATVNPEAALAWERVRDRDAPACERAAGIRRACEGGMKSLLSGFTRGPDGDSYRQHEDACIEELASWLAAHQARGAEVGVEHL